MTENLQKVRLDKWLWAARFYKTRNLSRQMIEGGKVQYNKIRTKPSKYVEIGAHITLWQGYNKIEVVVLALSETRKEAKLARLLYQETEESVKEREKKEDARKSNILFSPKPLHKPDKKQRRSLLELKNLNQNL
jgi:ribosome-associated heat shock protein Hsp15